VTSPRFVGRTAVVTGAGSGIGRATAIGLAREGARVVGVGRNEPRLQSAAAEADGAAGRIEAFEADLMTDEGIQDVASRLAEECAVLDILVHSAGVHAIGSVASTPIEELDRQYRTNLRAPYLLTQALIPMLKAADGQIVFLNSSTVRRAVAGLGAYAASKHALRGLADALRQELNPLGIRVLSVYPGRTAGPMQEALHRLEGRPYRPDRLLQPDDVAATIMDVLSLPRTAEVTDLHIRPMLKP
jgi:NAD(P)-dependent dehydrogenase (short-subunit alcohol dehydrogenase family)